ncbi:type II toxin-antitoxin system RatA family toxin [Thiomonas sp. FB-Cd]|uniref:type II toxin-antitoxin system RatA family toxin n=1 Tax=Thiomonas sp. FB-Cd TaxID=1158292 RepID=UPI000AFBC64B|nr:type II toxin-antitoxin system RatA family toxin [Thiomonas sp. FB-Cd]
MTSCRVQRDLAVPNDALFALVADVEAYPRYMPGWKAVRVLARAGSSCRVEQTINLVGAEITFESIAEWDPPHRLDIRATDSPSQPFRKFHLCWTFTPTGPQQTLLQVELECEFRSALLTHVARRMSWILLNRAIDAFERKATLLMDKPGIDSHGGSAASTLSNHDPSR